MFIRAHNNINHRTVEHSTDEHRITDDQAKNASFKSLAIQLFERRAPMVFLLSLLGVLLLSCSTSRQAMPSVGSLLKQYTNQDGRACVQTHRIRGWNAMDDSVVAIDGGSRYYLATLMPGCVSLTTSFGAVFEGDFGEVCGGATDTVKTAEGNCGVRELFEFPDRAAAQAALQTISGERRRPSQQDDTEH